MSDGHRTRILVLGAGVVGLSTAVQCHMTWPRAHVTVMADKFSEDTTSYGAGGIFRPTHTKTAGVPLDTLRRWLLESWRYYDSLAHSPDAGSCGTQIVSGYQFYNNTAQNELEKEFVYNYRPLTDREMKMFPGTENASHGFHVTTLMTEGSKYLKYLMEKFRTKGGSFIKHKLRSMEELVGRYDLVFNCTGLGSQELLPDEKIVAIRGQLIQVKAPWIKHTLLYGDEQLCFVYPGQEYCVVGCTRQLGDYNMAVRPEDTAHMWQTACRILPSLQKAERVSEWVGLRPHREPLRVEKQVLCYSNGSIKVVHNYGHGAEGISLSWGTSAHAVRLGQQLLTDAHTPHSKL